MFSMNNTERGKGGGGWKNVLSDLGSYSLYKGILAPILFSEVDRHWMKAIPVHFSKENTLTPIFLHN